MNKATTKLLLNDPYKRAITVVCGTHGQINEYFRDLGVDCDVKPSWRGGFRAVEHSGGQWAEFILLLKQGSLDEQIAVVAHESLHAVIWILQNAGLKLSDKSEEAYTYYHEWIFRQCLAILRQSRSTKRSRGTKAGSGSRRRRGRSGKKRRS